MSKDERIRASFPVWSEKDVAQIFDVEVFTISSFRKQGKGPPFMLKGDRVLYLGSKVEQWALENSSTIEEMKQTEIKR